MTRRKVKPISFRLYPEGLFLYCEVNIWPNKRAMLDHTRLGGTKYEACCGGRVAYKTCKSCKPAHMRRIGIFAEANFNRHAIGIEIVSHELTHAAFAFAERRRLDLADAVDKHYATGGSSKTMEIEGPEERFCYALGQMCRQFTAKCYKIGLYREVVESK